jgi:hypothetical protein
MRQLFIAGMLLTWVFSSHFVRTVDAQEGASSFRFIPPEAIGVVVVNPKGAMEGPGTELYPREVITAAGIQNLGIDPLQVEQLVAFIEAPTQEGPPAFGLLLRMSAAQDPQKIFPELMRGTLLADMGGRKFYRAAQPTLPSVMLPNDRTIVIAPEPTLTKMINNKVADSPLLKLLRAAPADRQLTAIVVLDPIRNMIRGQLSQAPPLPPPFEGLKQLPDQLTSIELRMNVTIGLDAELILRAPNAGAAKQVQDQLTGLLNIGKQIALAQVAQQAGSQDPVEQAMARYAQRLADHFATLLRPKLDGDRVTVALKGDTNVATSGVLVALLLPAVQAAREASRRMQASNNLKQIGLALHNHHDKHGKFPAQAISDTSGKPLLSWRVAILPFLHSQGLYDQFKLNEPWDSPNNKKLIPLMPQHYLRPGQNPSEGKTPYVMPTGKGTVNEQPGGMAIRDIRDGTSNTIMCMEANNDRAVIWTKPDDLEINPQQPLAGLADARPGGFLVLLADASVQFISQTIDLQVLRALFSPNGAETTGLPR